MVTGLVTKTPSHRAKRMRRELTAGPGCRPVVRRCERTPLHGCDAGRAARNPAARSVPPPPLSRASSSSAVRVEKRSTPICPPHVETRRTFPRRLGASIDDSRSRQRSGEFPIGQQPSSLETAAMDELETTCSARGHRHRNVRGASAARVRFRFGIPGRGGPHRRVPRDLPHEEKRRSSSW
jgi:hypothetical protein